MSFHNSVLKKLTIFNLKYKGHSENREAFEEYLIIKKEEHKKNICYCYLFYSLTNTVSP